MADLSVALPAKAEPKEIMCMSAFQASTMVVGFGAAYLTNTAQMLVRL